MRRRQKKAHPESTDARILGTMLIPVARLLLRHGYGTGEFLQAAKAAYVEAASAEITPVGRKANASRISVITGLTRKDVAVLLRARTEIQPYPIKRTLRQRTLRVL